MVSVYGRNFRVIPLTRRAADGAEWWARVPVSKRRGVLQHTRYGERRDDFDIS